MLSPDGILEQLDASAREFTFPMLDNGYIYFAGTRLSAYSNACDWALLIEHLGFNSRSLDTVNVLHSYGNCLSCPIGTSNQNFFYPLTDLTNNPLWEEDEQVWQVPQGKHKALVNGHRVEFEVSLEQLEKYNIKEVDQFISAPDVLRFLFAEHSELFWLNDAQLRANLKSEVPLTLRLNEWHHPDLAKEELPSRSETFQLLAQVLAMGRPELYQPTQIPNTHWRFWPEGGAL